MAVYGRYHSYSGSTLGGAEYVAEHLAEKLERRVLPPKRCTVRCWKIYLPGDLADYQLHPRCRRYSGQPFPFYEALQEQKPDLSAVRFGESVLVVVNMTPFVGLSINSRRTQRFRCKTDRRNTEDQHSCHDIPEDPAEEWLGSWINLLNKYTDRAIYCG